MRDGAQQLAHVRAGGLQARAEFGFGAHAMGRDRIEHPRRDVLYAPSDVGEHVAQAARRLGRCLLHTATAQAADGALLKIVLQRDAVQLCAGVDGG